MVCPKCNSIKCNSMMIWTHGRTISREFRTCVTCGYEDYSFSRSDFKGRLTDEMLGVEIPPERRQNEVIGE